MRSNRTARSRRHTHLSIGHRRQRLVDARVLSGHGEEGGNAESHAGRHGVLVKPEGHPGHDDQHTTRDVVLDEVV